MATHWQQFDQADCASLAGSDQSGYTSYIPASSSIHHYSPSRPQHMQQPAAYPTTPQQTFPGQYTTPYHHSDGSSQASSSDQQYPPTQYYSNTQQAGHFGGQGQFGAAPDQVSHLQAELAKKKQHIATLQHEIDTTESHRRQVQAHNFELQGQVDQMQQMFQGNLAGFPGGLDSAQLQQLALENTALKAQIAQLTQQLHEQMSFSQQHTAAPSTSQSEPQEQTPELQRKHDALVQQLRNDLDNFQAQEAEMKQDHQQQLSTMESEKQEQLTELETKHDILVQKLTQQKTQLEADLKHAQGVNSLTDDKRETAIRMLTQQRLQLEADLTKARAAGDQHDSEIKGLAQQRVQLEADVKKMKDDKEVVDDQLVKANLELAQTDEKLDAAEQKLKQAEQQAAKAAKTIRAQEKLVSQLRGECTNLKEEIDYLKNSTESSRSLIDENSRLKRESRLAHERFAKVQKENGELQARLMYHALRFEENDASQSDAATLDGVTDGQLDNEFRTANVETSDASERLQNVKLDAGSATSETATPRQHVEFPRPKSFRPRTHERRRSSDFGEHNAPKLTASPVVSLPPPTESGPI